MDTAQGNSVHGSNILFTVEFINILEDVQHCLKTMSDVGNVQCCGG